METCYGGHNATASCNAKIYAARENQVPFVSSHGIFGLDRPFTSN